MKYKDLKEAKKALGLPDEAALDEIKKRYRRLCHQWHPDKGKEKSSEMFRKVHDAYQAVLEYCRDYRYSFRDEDLRKFMSAEESWLERFGDDSFMGGAGNKKNQDIKPDRNRK